MSLDWGLTEAGNSRFDFGSVNLGQETDFTICAWIRYDANGAVNQACDIIRSGLWSETGGRWYMLIADPLGDGNGEVASLRQYSTTHSRTLVGTSQIHTDGTWQFIAATLPDVGAAPKIYLGDEATRVVEASSYSTQDTAVGTLRTGNNDVVIGNIVTNINESFMGAIAYVGLFSADLSLAEIEAIQYNSIAETMLHPNAQSCFHVGQEFAADAIVDLLGTVTPAYHAGTPNPTIAENPNGVRHMPLLGEFSPKTKSTATLLFLRPDADDTDGGWTDDGGGTNLFAQIDESVASDTDYIQSGLTPSVDKCKIRLSDPSASVDTTAAHTIRYRYKKQGDADTLDLTVRLVQGASTVIATWSHTNVAETFVDGSQVLTGPQIASITDYTDLYLEFEADTQ